MDRQLLSAAMGVAAASLRANIRPLKDAEGRDRTVLVAGAGQFASVWTRDFCFAAGGLLAVGEAQTVRHTLLEIIDRQRADGLFPRLLDSYHWATHFVRAATRAPIPLVAPLKANFTSDHFVTSIDGNALVSWAAARYALHTENYAWAGLVLPRLERAMAYYDAKERGGFIHQPPCSDWKDTVSGRRGAVFFTQLLRWKALVELGRLYAAMGRRSMAAAKKSRVRELARRTHRAFWDPNRGHFRDTLVFPRFSSDGNLAAAAWGFADEEESSRILRSMDRCGLLTPWGPRAGERHPWRQKGLLTLLAGIPGYHDDYVWLWNTALLLQTFFLLHREAIGYKLLESVCKLLVDAGAVSEVYRPDSGEEVRTWLYRSERPFSWSAAMLVEAFAKVAGEKTT
ncbi:MAG: hypothetical protein ABIJ96_04775 [Elusimicrobiota bacterium]